LTELTVRFQADPGLPPVNLPLSPDDFNQDFGQAVISTTWDVPANATSPGLVTVSVDPNNQLLEDKESDNVRQRSVRLRDAAPDNQAPQIQSVLISDDTPFNDADPFATSESVQVKIRATDNTGVTHYCIVRYHFSVALRLWFPLPCQFEPVPAAQPDGSFIVDEEIPDLENTPFSGVLYAFVWVRDAAGNISRQPGFDVISFIPDDVVFIRRNDVRIFRIPLAENAAPLTLSFDVLAGDVDVSVFDDFIDPGANRIAISAQNGPICEQVTLTPAAGQPNRFQVEVHAIANSQVEINLAPCPVLSVAASAVPAEAQQDLPDQPTIAGPPLRAAVEDEGDQATGSSLYLPIVIKSAANE
jgi:hypothetical protein